MLSQDSRKFSAPAFPVSEQEDFHFVEHNLPRSPEVPNIPETVLTRREELDVPRWVTLRLRHETASADVALLSPSQQWHLAHAECIHS